MIKTEGDIRDGATPRNYAYKCHCRALSIEARLQSVGVPIPEAGWTTEKLEPQLADMAHSIQTHLNQDHDVLVCGPNGRGKTCACVVILRNALLAGIKVRYVFVLDWLSGLRNSYAENYEGPTEREQIEELCRPELLYLDDLGAEEKITGWVRQMVSLLLRSRRALMRRTLITTNLSMLETEPTGLLAMFGSSVHSRLKEYRRVVVPEGVPDLRGRREKVQGR